MSRTELVEILQSHLDKLAATPLVDEVSAYGHEFEINEINALLRDVIDSLDDSITTREE